MCEYHLHESNISTVIGNTKRKKKKFQQYMIEKKNVCWK